MTHTLYRQRHDDLIFGMHQLIQRLTSIAEGLRPLLEQLHRRLCSGFIGDWKIIPLAAL